MRVTLISQSLRRGREARIEIDGVEVRAMVTWVDDNVIRLTLPDGSAWEGDMSLPKF